MKVPLEHQALHLVAQRLAELVGVEPGELQAETDERAPHADRVLRAGSLKFVVEWKGSGAVAPVTTVIDQVRRYAHSLGRTVIPLVAVPFMGDVGKRLCDNAQVAWIDLSGNACIHAPGLRILIEGKPNRYLRPGRPSSAFAPKSSRIARWLLMHPTEELTQREIARATNTDEGYTSRVVGKLLDDGLVVREESGAIHPVNPNLLLDAWREDYDFSKHHLIQGHVAARSSDALLRQLSDGLNRESISYAATGLAAAWLIDHFAGFRIVTLYLAEAPSPDLLASLSFREDARGANVWLAVPNDEGVFQGSTLREGIRSVHPVQAYLDLLAHPERAEEAAQKLRSEHLNWRTHA